MKALSQRCQDWLEQSRAALEEAHQGGELDIDCIGELAQRVSEAIDILDTLLPLPAEVGHHQEGAETLRLREGAVAQVQPEGNAVSQLHLLVYENGGGVIEAEPLVARSEEEMWKIIERLVSQNELGPDQSIVWITVDIATLQVWTNCLAGTQLDKIYQCTHPEEGTRNAATR